MRSSRLQIAAVAMAIFLPVGGCQHVSATTLPEPPAAALLTHPKPVLEGDTQGDLARGFVERGRVIDELNAQIEVLRTWAAQVQKRFGT